jgi:hypothetical protein
VRSLFLMLLLSAACPARRAPWTVTPSQGAAWDAVARAIIERVKAVTGDKSGRLAAGGAIHVHTPPDWITLCEGRDPTHVSGCNAAGRIDILLYPGVGLGPGAEKTALAHEACHLGGETGGGVFGGPVDQLNEADANACAAKALIGEDK